MAGQSNNVKSTDVSSAPSSPEVPATPRRPNGPLSRDSTAAPQLSSPTLRTLQSISPDLEENPTAGRHEAVYMTCSPLDDGTWLSSDNFFTPMPLTFGIFSLSHVPDTPLSSRGRGLSCAQARSNDNWFEEEDFTMIPRSLFGALPPDMQVSSFPSSPTFSSTAPESASSGEEDDGLSSDSDDDTTFEYTATGSPFSRHKCTQDCKQNPWFCPRTPEPQF